VLDTGLDELAGDVLCDLEGFGYQEIAAMLDIPIGTVRSRIFRARASLKELLPAEMGRT
jgi:DNA-directed RNA polymerase specialized sigma24 family protein